MTQTLTIRSVTTRIVSLKQKRPVISRAVSIDTWSLLLIDLETEEGITGRTYLSAYSIDGARYCAKIIHDLVERFKSQAIAPVDLYDKGRKALFFMGYEGVTMAAISGLDMAFWDAAAKAANLPLARLLGGSLAPVKAYNSCALWLKSPEETADEAVELRDMHGFKAVKMRLGRENPRDDVKAVEAVMTTLGPDTEVMCDYNQLNTLDEALRRCAMIDDLGLGWIEEPIRYDDFDGAAELKRRLKTPIQIGENFWGPRDLWRAVQLNACDYVMPDLMRIGGVTGWQRAAGLAGTIGLPFSSHLFPEVSGHLLRVTESAHWLEWTDWSDEILLEPFVVKSGMVQIPDRPGAGIEWNEARVKANLIE